MIITPILTKDDIGCHMAAVQDLYFDTSNVKDLIAGSIWKVANITNEELREHEKRFIKTFEDKICS